MSNTAERTLDLATLRQPAAGVEGYVKQFLDGRSLPANLDAAIRYSLLGAGKRLRPILVVHACGALGGDVAAALPPAAAIEMIHCFSLVHDDLPAMDDDDLRRGRPTLHRHTNEAMAILAGDAMMGLAFELIATEVADAQLAGRLSAELATATNDMIAGQVYDTLPEFPESTGPADRLETVHRHKTAALIRCSCRMGALCGGADEGQLAAMTRYGESVGLMFQVVDDLLDVTATTEQLGKSAGKDAEQGKLTYPSVHGIEGSREHVERLEAAALEALSGFGDEGEPLRALCEYMSVRTN
ncbi:MAG: hypothetical protein CMJ18_03585 [Phycisphaeraceae bacterium]|nr:hypothetical protein [Phycisphaeraceae bacterium]